MKKSFKFKVLLAALAAAIAFGAAVYKKEVKIEKRAEAQIEVLEKQERSLAEEKPMNAKAAKKITIRKELFQKRMEELRKTTEEAQKVEKAIQEAEAELEKAEEMLYGYLGEDAKRFGRMLQPEVLENTLSQLKDSTKKKYTHIRNVLQMGFTDDARILVIHLSENYEGMAHHLRSLKGFFLMSQSLFTASIQKIESALAILEVSKDPSLEAFHGHLQNILDDAHAALVESEEAMKNVEATEAKLTALRDHLHDQLDSEFGSLFKK